MNETDPEPTHEVVAFARRYAPGDSLEIRVFNPDSVSIDDYGGVDWQATKYTSILLFPAGIRTIIHPEPVVTIND
jgi:hypothetical protein